MKISCLDGKGGLILTSIMKRESKEIQLEGLVQTNIGCDQQYLAWTLNISYGGKSNTANLKIMMANR
jgi:hypothetical protein